MLIWKFLQKRCNQKFSTFCILCYCIKRNFLVPYLGGIFILFDSMRIPIFIKIKDLNQLEIFSFSQYERILGPAMPIQQPPK